MAVGAGRLALTIFRSLKSTLKGPGRFKRTMGAAGRGGRMAAAAGVGGAIGLGVNPLLGLMAGNLIRGGKGGGKGGAGASGAGAGGGGADPTSSRDSSIIAGMRPHSPMKQINVGTLRPNADFRTMLTYTAKASQATYLTSLQNNRELIYVQKMLQGPTAARAKELRMESQRQALSPVVVNNFYGGGGGDDGGGMGMLGLAGLGAAAAAIAGLVAAALSEDDIAVRTSGRPRTRVRFTKGGYGKGFNTWFEEQQRIRW